MYVSPATAKAFAEFEAEENEERPFLQEKQRDFHNFNKRNDEIDILIPETRNALAQFETEENGEDGMFEKRGIRRCIHRCLKGSGMSFIQCKSMCHW